MNTRNTIHKKILITGGHVTPAVSVIDELTRRHADWEIVFVGRKVALEGSSTVSEEYRIITDKHIRFLPIIAGRLKRDGGMEAVVSLLKVPVGCIQALRYVLAERPDIIMSFGGYVALPVVLVAWMAGVPVITHEQTRKPGLANRIISRFAKKTCVSYPEAVSGLGKNVVFTGLPLRDSVFHPPKSVPQYVSHIKKPFVLILGGSTGAMSVNAIVYDALPELLHTYAVVHQVGRVSEQKAKKVQSALSEHQTDYVPVPYISESEYSWLLHHAALVVGRSGANTVMEIASVGKVALFVPLPWAAGNEQYYNAKFLEDAGSADILTQDALTPKSLIRAITSIHETLSQREKAAREIASKMPRDGAKKLVDVIDTVISA